MQNCIKCNSISKGWQAGLHQFINQYWYQKHFRWLTGLLIPFSYLFAFLAFTRRKLYQFKILKTTKLNCPVIVVGNITVGGTGKTPVVAGLVNFLRQQGYSPGVVSRGYAGKQESAVLLSECADPRQVGDEPLWLFKTLACPVAIGRKRVDAAKLLIQAGCNIIISDDGLQHYALARDMEIVLIDGLRLFGNGYLLPAGPLREPISRLKTGNFILANQLNRETQIKLEEQLNCNKIKQSVISLEVIPLQWKRLSDGQKFPLSYFAQEEVHAIAGIANPERFYQTLKELSIAFIPHSFPDHYAFKEKDIIFNDNRKVVMTEKDGIKCASFCHQNIYVLEIQVRLPEVMQQIMLRQLKS